MDFFNKNPYCIILKEFGWLGDFYALDYFIENHWNRLPKSWQTYFDDRIKFFQSFNNSRAKLVELIETIISLEKFSFASYLGPFPLSLIVLKKCIKIFSINRFAVLNKGDIEQKIFGKKKNFENKEFTNLNEILPKQFLTKIKAKKLHEISRVYNLLDVILQNFLKNEDLKNWQILDVGSGIGHLSRILSILLRCDVITIEGNPEFVKKSLEIDKKFNYKVCHAQKINNQNFKWKAPTRNLVQICSEKQITKNQNNKKNMQNQNNQILIGLHACGDLTPKILKNFVLNNNAKILLIVGCCYHKLNGGLDKPFLKNCNEKNFSLKTDVLKKTSYFLSQRFSSVSLSYASRELACFSTNCFLEQMHHLTNSTNFCVIGYRAILEWLILDCPPLNCNTINVSKLRHCGLGGVKNVNLMNFWDYAVATLQFNSELKKVVEKKKNDKFVVKMVDELLNKEAEKILIMYSLRQILGPLIETIIIEDYKAFLEEKSKVKNISIIPLFKSNISPRNLSLIAIKNYFL